MTDDTPPGVRIGSMAVALLADLDTTYGTDCKVMDALLIVEVTVPDENGDLVETVVEHRCTTHRMAVAIGLANCALDSLQSYHGRDPGDDPDGE